MSMLERIETLPVGAQLSFLALAVLYGLWIFARFGSLGDFREKLGLSEVPPWIVAIFGVLWLGLAIILTVGLYILIIDVLIHEVPPRYATNLVETNQKWDWRFKLVQITALTTVLGAVVVLPITLNRLRLQREANETAEKIRRNADETLFNEKFKAASDDLHARRAIKTEQSRTGLDFDENFIEDDIVRRTAAIDRLEGLAQERPSEAPRVARLLCVYLRELSKLIGPDHVEHPRADMEAAAQTIGRIHGNLENQLNQPSLQLQKVNFCDFNLRKLAFSKASFFEATCKKTSFYKSDMASAYFLGATLDRANFVKANLKHADLRKTNLEMADLSKADLKGADVRGATLIGTHLQGANLEETQFQGAELNAVYLDEHTVLTGVNFRGASLRNVSTSTALLLKPYWQDIFVDDSVIFPDAEELPSHWESDLLLDEEFYELWRNWQRSIGQAPYNPE